MRRTTSDSISSGQFEQVPSSPFLANPMCQDKPRDRLSWTLPSHCENQASISWELVKPWHPQGTYEDELFIGLQMTAFEQQARPQHSNDVASTAVQNTALTSSRLTASRVVLLLMGAPSMVKASLLQLLLAHPVLGPMGAGTKRTVQGRLKHKETVCHHTATRLSPHSRGKDCPMMWHRYRRTARPNPRVRCLSFPTAHRHASVTLSDCQELQKELMKLAVGL